MQNELEPNQTDGLIQKEMKLLKEFDSVLEQEELIWFQKSREKWVVNGDRSPLSFIQ